MGSLARRSDAASSIHTPQDLDETCIQPLVLRNWRGRFNTYFFQALLVGDTPRPASCDPRPMDEIGDCNFCGARNVPITCINEVDDWCDYCTGVVSPSEEEEFFRTINPLRSKVLAPCSVTQMCPSRLSLEGVLTMILVGREAPPRRS